MKNDNTDIRLLEDKEPHLLIIKKYINNRDLTDKEYRSIPIQMKIDLALDRYSLENGVLYHHKKTSMKNIRNWKTQSIYKTVSNKTKKPAVIHQQTDQKEPDPNPYIFCFECKQTGHIAANCPNVTSRTLSKYRQYNHSTSMSSISDGSQKKFSDHSDGSDIQNTNIYSPQYPPNDTSPIGLLQCGCIIGIPACFKCMSTRPINSTTVPQHFIANQQFIQPQSQRTKSINGTIFYLQFGDKLEDWSSLKVSPNVFTYNQHQNVLICGECDFSLSACLILKFGVTGSNMCCTSWYYYKTQWYKGIENEIGTKAFSQFVENMQFCTDNFVSVTFGIDAKFLHITHKRWNKKNIETFDRIIFTFPRIYDEKRNHVCDRIQYHSENYRLLLNILGCAKNYLSENGEIHVMFLKGQFLNFKINKILNELGLKMAFWSEMNEYLLNNYFNGYTPRDCYGNEMKIDNAIMHFCSFRKTMQNVINVIDVNNSYAYSYQNYLMQNTANYNVNVL